MAMVRMAQEFSLRYPLVKGQGNFEGLSDEKRKIFFILKAKCDVIANYLKVEKGSLIFKLNKLK